MENELGGNYWENRWENGEIRWDLGKVSPAIKKYVDQLTNKDLSILIPGCGNAYEAEYLFEKGFKNTYIVEISVSAIDSFLSRCPSFPKTNIFNTDFFELKGAFDLIIEHTFFCALSPNLRPNYVNKMAELLPEKGKIVGLMFDMKRVGGPPFEGNSNEYKKLFQDKFDILGMDTAYNSVPDRAGKELFVRFQKK